MERRLKLAYISMNEVCVHGKGVDRAIKAKLPEGAEVIAKESCLEIGSLKVVIYSPEFPVVALGAKLDESVIELDDPKERPVKLIYAH